MISWQTVDRPLVDHKVSDLANAQYLVQLGKPIVEKDQEVIFTLFDGEMRASDR